MTLYPAQYHQSTGGNKYGLFEERYLAGENDALSNL